MKYLLIRAMLKLGLLKYFNLVYLKRINNKKFKLPLFGTVGYGNIIGDDEEWMYYLLRKLFTLGIDNFIDVGANIGQTLLKTYSVKNVKNYICLEPNSSCIYYLNRLIYLNKLDNCTVLPIGVYENTELIELNMFSNSEVDTAASIIKDFRKSESVQWKKIIPVFDSKRLKGYIDLDELIIKIDVEGAELEVIKSLKWLVVKNKPVIICEILPIYSDQNILRQTRQKQLEELLNELNYTIYRIHEASKLERIENIGIHSDLKLSNYIFVPSILKSRIESIFELITQKIDKEH